MGSRLDKNSESTRKRIESHNFEDEAGDEYEGSKFGGFPEYFRRKKIKLQNLDAELRSKSSDNPQIFKGIVAQVNGYTQPSLNDLHRLIVSHGGGFCQYLDGKTSVTHIIAANLTPKKAVEFKKYRIVKPAWIVDSVAGGKILPWERYRVLDEGVGQRKIGFDEGKIVSQANATRRGYRDQTDTSWYTSQFKGLAEDIDHTEGANFPGSQTVVTNGYLPQSSRQQSNEQGRIASDVTVDPSPSNPESYGVTSSLEDALDEIAEDEPVERLEIDEPVVTSEPFHDIIDEPEPGSIEGHQTPISRSQSGKSSLSIDSPSPSPNKKQKPMTAEEHNAVLLADPHIRKSSTANPEFLKQYYSESRLHHLSTWKADLKAKMQQLASEKSSSQKPAKRKPGSRRYIIHVDFDSFFCAVSLKNAPQYMDKPAVVAHGSGTGSEIASCNYPARAFGVKNGMWMKNALSLCPDIKVLPYDFPAYEEASESFYEAIIDVGGIIQSVSVDEALVDITSIVLPEGGTDGDSVREDSILREQERADELANALRIKIKEKTGCAVSIGIGGNILLAKIALRKAKPAGQYQIKPEEILDFIGELAVQDLPGVARSIGGKLEEIGVAYVKDVRSLSKERLITVLGPKTGEKIWEYASGVDKVEVGEQVVRKSISAEVNWGIRFTNQAEAEDFVQKLCEELRRRLLEQGMRGKQLTVKIMRKSVDAPLDPPKHLGHGKCDTFNKSIVLGVATNSAEVIGKEAISVLRSYGSSPGELRGLGVQMTKLELLKPLAQGQPDGSQRRITFNAAPARPTPAVRLQREITGDPIDDPTSPLKLKTPVHPAMFVAHANAGDRSATKLNLTGTQFIIPSQIDPKIIAELPMDIRSRLMAQQKDGNKSGHSSRAQSPVIMFRPESPSRPDRQEKFELPSQLDPEVFLALPEDMKAEILRSYSAERQIPVSGRATKGQSAVETRTATLGPAKAHVILPQSPRKNRSVNLSTKETTPTKKRGGLLSRGRGRPRNNGFGADSYSTLTQSNFVASKRSGLDRHEGNDSDTSVESVSGAELDPDFLLALPEDVRHEVIAEHRRSRLARLNLATAMKNKRGQPQKENLKIGEKRIRLLKRPERPTFTTAKLSTLAELRGTMQQWYDEFKDDGPFNEDVMAMERYLRRVVLEEKDMAKVVGLMKWVAWVVGEAENDEVEVRDAENTKETVKSNDKAKRKEKGNGGRQAWLKALEGMKEKIQEAVKERGLGRLQF